jgi:hypothetical protein
VKIGDETGREPRRQMEHLSSPCRSADETVVTATADGDAVLETAREPEAVR